MSTLKINKLEQRVKKLNESLARERMINELELDKLNSHWAEKFSLIVDMMEAQINQDIEIEENVFRPQTLSEFKKWFREWTDDVNGVNASDDNAGEQMADVIDKHGFKFVKRKPQMDITARDVIGRRK